MGNADGQQTLSRHSESSNTLRQLREIPRDSLRLKRECSCHLQPSLSVRELCQPEQRRGQCAWTRLIAHPKCRILKAVTTLSEPTLDQGNQAEANQ